jgi:general secretion pathway protein D
MPRLLTAFTLLTLVVLLVFSCGGPPKKPAPPEKASGPVVAKGTTTTDLPEGGEATVAPRSYTTEEYVARLMKDQGMEDRPGIAPVPAPLPGAAVAPDVPEVPPTPAVPVAPAPDLPVAPTPDLPVVPAPVAPIPEPPAVEAPAPFIPPAPSAPGVEAPKYPVAPAAGSSPSGGPVEPASYPKFSPKDAAPATGVEPAKYPGKVAPVPIPAPPAAEPVAPMPGPVPPAPVPPAPMPEPLPPVASPPVPPPPVAPPPAYESEADRRMRELAEKKRVELQYEEYLVDYYIGQAEGHFAELRYPEAEEWILKALDRQPDNQKAIELYQRILAAQGRRAGEIPSARTELQRLHEVKGQEAKAQAAHYFSEGEKAYGDKRYDEAITNFDNVLTIIDNAPYGVDWGTMKSDANDFLFRCRQDKVKYEEELGRDRARQALDQVRKEELKRKQAAEERISKLLTEAIEAFENERFDLAENLAEQVMALDPMNARAREILEQSVRARHLTMSDTLLRATKERFREWRIDIRETTVPWSDRPLEWPSQSEWDRISRRASALTDLDISSDMDPADQALKNRLQQEIVGFSFENATMPEALDVLRQLKDVNIVIDDAVKSDLEAAPVTLTVTSLEFESALNLLLRLAGTDYTYVLRNGVVFITNREGARGKAILRVHTVGDLTIKLTNFIAPSLILKPAGAEIDDSQPPFGKAEEGEQIFGGGVEDLMQLVIDNIEPESWEGGAFNIQPSGEDKLVVVHTPEVQAEVARFLNDLRRFAGLVVTIETRFLTVSDDFLQDVGVDVRGLGGEKGPLVNLDDVTNGLEDAASAGFDNGGPGLPSASGSKPSAGVFYNNFGDGDYRGRTEQIFDSALGSILSPLGGAVIQYTMIDDTDVSIIVRAVQKTRQGRLLQAPVLTVYNTQRANITLINQLSFIQDFDVEVAQTAFIADPIVGIIQDGLTLDVRPTISHDRKYVTLQLQPTIATLIRPIPTFQTSLGALTTPVTIQIPELIIQKSQTTVRVPDGGSLVIGGLKNISLVDMQSEVPFLAKIPILGFLFSRKGSSKEVENLMVIVTTRITDLEEEEARFRSPLR